MKRKNIQQYDHNAATSSSYLSTLTKTHKPTVSKVIPFVISLKLFKWVWVCLGDNNDGKGPILLSSKGKNQHMFLIEITNIWHVLEMPIPVNQLGTRTACANFFQSKRDLMVSSNPAIGHPP